MVLFVLFIVFWDISSLVFSHTINIDNYILIKNKHFVMGKISEETGTYIGNAAVCCSRCAKTLECSAVAVRKDAKECILLLELLNESHHLAEDNQWNVYKVNKAGQWQLIFRASAGVDIPVMETWEGSIASTNTAECKDVRGSKCHGHYRSSMIDLWSSFNINKVMVKLYTNGKFKAWVIFDGKGSDNFSWFSKERILKSSWNGVNPSGSYNGFALYRENKKRIFYIAKHLGCTNDKGYLMGLDTNGNPACSYESLGDSTLYPQFLYSKSNSEVVWESKDYEMADTLAVFIQL